MDHPITDSLFEELNKLGQMCPRDIETFEAFRRTDQNKLRGVWVGQDPYPVPGVATGVAFEAHDNVDTPVSLKRLKHALMGSSIQPDGNSLRPFTDAGYLLINARLTCHPFKPNSHAKIWAKWMTYAIDYIQRLPELTTWLLFGSVAKRLEKNIKPEKRNIIYEFPHPAARDDSFDNVNLSTYVSTNSDPN